MIGFEVGLTALLEFFDLERGAGRFVIVEILGAGPRALERRRRVLEQMIAVVDEGRGESKRCEQDPPPLTAEGLVGGAFSLIHSRLLPDTDAPLVELVGPLMSMIVLPYLRPGGCSQGAGAACYACP